MPGPGSVEVKGEFQKGSVRPKAFSFGLAREYFKKVYFKECATVDPVVPGPGRYSLTTCIGNDAKPVTIKGKNMKERSQSKYCTYVIQYQPRGTLLYLGQGSTNRNLRWTV